MLAGSVGLTEESDDTATLRWFVLDRQLRGHGLGSRMLKEMLTSAERGGYARVTLETFSELTAAARLYRRHGFRLLSEDTAPRWGRDAITYQRYELELGSPAARRGGGSRLARPAAFSA